MHLKSIRINDIRSFEQLEWELSPKKLQGWHVIIGDNGSGKSTFLRCVALSLCGPREMLGLRDNWESWRRIGADKKLSSVTVTFEDHKDWDDWKGRGRQVSNFYLSCGFNLVRSDDGERIPRAKRFKHDPVRHVWSRASGWFSASYGPFRRFTGGDAELRSIQYTHSILARHITVFGENAALGEPLEWLSQLKFEQLDNNEESGALLENVKNFVNQEGFLPHGVKFDSVTSKSVVFRNPEGIEIDVTKLSDGFRSILSMTFEIIRQLFSCYGKANLFERRGERIRIMAPGVVLVDEIDAHLHPTWQRRIGFWLTEHFPELQFIVTTHSPLVCQAAENGSVFRLPAPGSNQKESGFVTGPTLDRLVHGDVLDAYGTDLFGDDIERSTSTKERMERLAVLNQKSLSGDLERSEKKELLNLKRALSAHIQSPF